MMKIAHALVSGRNTETHQPLANCVCPAPIGPGSNAPRATCCVLLYLSSCSEVARVFGQPDMFAPRMA